MPSPPWPRLPAYSDWAATCDTLHAHTQVLGKLAVRLAPPEPQLQHAALRLTARGWETPPLPLPDDSGAVVVALDLHAHEAVVEHSDGPMRRVPLTPDRAVGAVTREVVGAVDELAGGSGLKGGPGPAEDPGLAGDPGPAGAGDPGPAGETELRGDAEHKALAGRANNAQGAGDAHVVTIDPTPQEVPWSVPLDEDDQHARFDTAQVETYFAAATRAALVLAAFRAPYRGPSTPVNAWWGSFDLAVNLFSGEPADPPSQDFIMRNAMDAQEVAVGWWPGDQRHDRAAFYAYAHPAPDDFSTGTLTPAAARWEDSLGEYVLDWDDVCSAPDPYALALEFARSAFAHACVVCAWDPALLASAQGQPPPVA